MGTDKDNRSQSLSTAYVSITRILPYKATDFNTFFIKKVSKIP